jgi:laminin alpha 3/5
MCTWYEKHYFHLSINLNLLFKGYFRYPDCIPCSCDMHGSLGLSCDQTTGQCVCKSNFISDKCQECAPGMIYPFF